jgi:CheY-like chemotaxis protein
MKSSLTPENMNFLIIDDMDNMRRSVRAMLKLVKYGKNFYEAPHGKEAWKMLSKKNHGIDFIICDYNMPYMSGTELLHLIRADKLLRDIPFLMITADANKEVVAEAAEHDVDAYLTKPFVTASLENKINELLEKAQNPDIPTQLLRASKAAEEKGDIKAAIHLALEASQANRSLSRPYRELGRLFIKIKNVKQAISQFTQAIELNRLDVTSYHYLGQLYLHQGKLDKAIDFYSKAMDISPRHSDRAFKFADLLIKKNQPQKAEKILRIILKHDPSNQDNLEKIAALAGNIGFPELAIKCYKDILKHAPRRLSIHKLLGLALQQKGQYNQASAYLEKAAGKFTEDVELLVALARSYLEMDMLVRADKYASKALKVDPDNMEAKSILSKC